MKLLSLCFILLLQIDINAQNPEFVMWEDLKIGAEQTNRYLHLLEGKRIGVVANHTSVVNNEHLIDFLISQGCIVSKIFGLEHGFRGNVSDGETIKDGKDVKTGIPIISLYGKKKKPTIKDLNGLDVIIIDIQDVGVRFYTYLTSMSYMMEACAESSLPMIIFDRPNPNGFYVDGPILEEKHQSFVGIHPIPIVHGMTLGEYALMAKGENWVKNADKCEVNIITVKNYDHNQTMALPIKPSPNLPTHNSILLYPSLALFEGTFISVGRGTNKPFEQIGHPELECYKHNFIPISMTGISKYPPQENKECFGLDLSKFYKNNPEQLGRINLEWIMKFYEELKEKEDFFNAYFYKLSGVDTLRWQIYNGRTEEEIRKSWDEGLNRYKKIRVKYLLYPDFQ